MENASFFFARGETGPLGLSEAMGEEEAMGEGTCQCALKRNMTYPEGKPGPLDQVAVYLSLLQTNYTQGGQGEKGNIKPLPLHLSITVHCSILW